MRSSNNIYIFLYHYFGSPNHPVHFAKNYIIISTLKPEIMKTRPFLTLVLIIGSFISAFAGNPLPGQPVNLLFFTPNPFLGVRTGDKVDFYQFKSDTGWVSVYYAIDLPEKTEEVFMTPNGFLGTRSGNILNFYYIGWFGMLETVDSLTFEIPCQADEVIMSAGGDLGIRCGKELMFYYYEKGWRHNIDFDYTFPADEDEPDELIMTTTNLLGVRRADVLKFYDIKNRYTRIDQGYIAFNADVDELLITAAGEMAVRSGDIVKLYKFTELWEPIPELEFTIKKPE